jgi:hypothetical protein
MSSIVEKSAKEFTTKRATSEQIFRMVREAGVEPTTFGSGGRRSIQLSYSRCKHHNMKPAPFAQTQSGHKKEDG